MTEETMNTDGVEEVVETTENCCAAEPGGQINLFGETVASPAKKKKEEKKPTTTVSANRMTEASDKEFEEEEKLRLIYSCREIPIEPEDALAPKKEIWEKYLRQFPEFQNEDSFKYTAFSLGKEGLKGNVYPVFKAGPKG